MLAARLGGLWFGIQVVWTAILGVVLQDRASALAPHAIETYAALAIAGATFGAATQVLAGIVSDRRRARTGGRRLFYLTGVAIAIPSAILVCASPTLGSLWIGLLGLQLGMNVAGGPYQAVVTDHFPVDEVGRASSWMSIHQFLGSVVGLALTTVLHGALLGAGLGAGLALGWLVTDRAVATLPPSRSPAAPLRLDAAIRTVLASRAAINVGFYTLFGFLFFFVQESLHVADARTTTGALFLAFTIAAVPGAAVSGRFADRFDKRNVVSVACVAIGLAVAAFAFASGVPVAVVCAIASGAAWGAFATADWAIAYAVLPRASMAAAMGVWNLAAALPQIAAPAITAPLVRIVDARAPGMGPRVALALVIVELTLGTLWLWRLRRSDLLQRSTVV